MVTFTPEVLQRLGGRGPRYTSYPTADRFVEAFDPARARYWLSQRGVGGLLRPIGLYVHIPFCSTACWYCACNRIATKDRSRADRYLDDLLLEIDRISEIAQGTSVQQLHLGGGTPTFLNGRQMTRLIRHLESRFMFLDGAERSIEMDPRDMAPGTVELLASLGFNRASLGVQDFDPDVQHAINRVQSVEATREAINRIRANGFTSVNLDLIYGLPRQNEAGFDRTLDAVIDARPDRVALYAYAHLPAMFKTQRRILAGDLPSPGLRLALINAAIRRLGEAGYTHIGMDHFALGSDDLARAQREGRLTRNFQGYSAGGGLDTVGLGVSAISQVGSAYWQNAKSPEDYRDRLVQTGLPVVRGLELNADDLVRRAVIQALACQFTLSMESLGIAHLIDFREYFSRELVALEPFVRDGLVELDNEWLVVTPAGRLAVRAICAVFDRYLSRTHERSTASSGVPTGERYSAVV